MMTFNYILNKIKNPDDIKDIKASYEYANSKLSGIMRKNGDTEISHCLEVANILIDLNVDKETIICAILHSVLDFNDIDEKEIVENFSLETYKIIFSLSKINNLEMVDDSESAALYLRKVMVGLSEDVRVLFIKLADRLHNMRTFDAISTERQKKVANETLSVLVPIAHRLGINSIKSELENLCLYYLKPDVYNDILEKLNATVDSLNNYLIEMQESICDLLNENEIKFEIKGRVKSVYSIYNKLSTGKKWDDIYDILALRIFVDKESDCYAVVGLIHSKFRPIPSRFKDYIAVPKENMYQSLHTTVFGPGGKFYEIQIRTYEMDEIAEKGIASHWSYKEKGTKKIQTYMEQKLEIYRSIIENSENDTDEVFNEVVGSNILGNLMYVFTPKGDVIELPEDATPIDFAYRVHSKVGDTMTGAIVNDIMVSINTPLHDGDICKILTNPNSTPSKEWLNIVKTTQAKDKIKAYFSKIDNTFDDIVIIFVLFLIATPFPIALPPIVRAAIVAVTNNDTINRFISNFEAIEVATATPAVPDTIPQISPTTSLQIDDTLSEFLINLTAIFEPFTFLAFIEIIGLSSADVTATPIISNTIPNKINISTNIIPSIKLASLSIVSDKKENNIDIANAIIVIVIIHFLLFFFILLLIIKRDQVPLYTS